MAKAAKETIQQESNGIIFLTLATAASQEQRRADDQQVRLVASPQSQRGCEKFSTDLMQNDASSALPYVGYAVSAPPPPRFQRVEFNSNTMRSQTLLCFLNGKHLAQCGMKIKLEVHFCLFSL